MHKTDAHPNMEVFVHCGHASLVFTLHKARMPGTESSREYDLHQQTLQTSIHNRPDMERKAEMKASPWQSTICLASQALVVD